MQQLQDKSGSGVVPLPKDDSDRDDVLTDDGEIAESQSVFVERVDDGVYVVRLCDGGDVPALETTSWWGASPRRCPGDDVADDSGPLKIAD